MSLCVLLGGACESNAQTLREARGQPVAATSAQPTQPPEPVGKEIPFDDSLQKYITNLVIEQLPAEYENKKKWGTTKRLQTGLDWEFHGLKVETHRQMKEVNHGTWTAYKLRVIDAADTFQVRLDNLRDVGDNTAECDLTVAGNISCTGRIAEWRRGMQLYSVGVEGVARVKLVAHIAVKMGFDLRTLPPDILLTPRVTRSDLILEDLRLERVGKAEGIFVKQLSSVVEKGLDDYLAEHRDKLTEKMNQQLEKKKDKLRLPLSTLVKSPWGNWFGGYFDSHKK